MMTNRRFKKYLLLTGNCTLSESTGRRKPRKIIWKRLAIRGLRFAEKLWAENGVSIGNDNFISELIV